MARAAWRGAGTTARLTHADEVQPTDLLFAGGFLFICPENLGSMSGAMKEMFDRCYYPVLGRIEGCPYASIIAAGSDGEGAQRELDRIAKGWRLKRVADPMIVNFNAQTADAILAPKVVPAGILARCEEMGAAMQQGLSLGIF